MYNMVQTNMHLFNGACGVVISIVIKEHLHSLSGDLYSVIYNYLL